MRGSLAERLMARVTLTEAGCWMWTGSLRDGYGQIWTSVDAAGHRQLLDTHRASYELARGPIPEGMDLDHRCHNADAICAGGPDCPHRACVNPEHLEPATRRVNVLRGRGLAAQNARKTRCKAGHRFGDERYPNGSRRCVVCDPLGAQLAGDCGWCGEAIEYCGSGRSRRFCDDRCRNRYHNQRAARARSAA